MNTDRKVQGNSVRRKERMCPSREGEGMKKNSGDEREGAR